MNNSQTAPELRTRCDSLTIYSDKAQMLNRQPSFTRENPTSRRDSHGRHPIPHPYGERYTKIHIKTHPTWQLTGNMSIQHPILYWQHSLNHIMFSSWLVSCECKSYWVGQVIEATRLNHVHLKHVAHQFSVNHRIAKDIFGHFDPQGYLTIRRHILWHHGTSNRYIIMLEDIVFWLI